MNILEKIVETKKQEVLQRSAESPVRELRQHDFYKRPCLSLKPFLLDSTKTGIIAEFKRRSPSKGVINEFASLLEVTAAYSRNGASALSVLTDSQYFGGTKEDLIAARSNHLPILRKDFVIDPYQVEETKAIGADIILLIASCLRPAEVRNLAALAHNLGLEVLLEIHDREELGHLCEEVDFIGVNNRDLKTFTVDIQRSVELSELVPQGFVRITESGIYQPSTIHLLRRYGYLGFLIGENFMKEPDPAIAFASFVNELKKEPHEGKSLRHDATGTGKKAG